MKKFMVVLLALALTGCGSLATRSPGEQMGQQAGGAVVGAVTGDFIYKNVGRKGGTNPLPSRVIGGLIGYSTVAQAQANARAVASGGVAGGGSQQQYYGYAPMMPSTYPQYVNGVTVPCDTRPSSAGMAPPRLGNCLDPRRPGSEASYDSLVREAQARETDRMQKIRIMDPTYGVEQPMAVVRYQQPERGRQAQNTRPVYDSQSGGQESNQFDLSVDNYLESDWVRPQCKTGNQLRNADCLDRVATELDGKQTACQNGSGPCKLDYNDLATTLRGLARDIRSR